MKKLLKNKPILLCIPVLLYLGLLFLGGIFSGIKITLIPGLKISDPLIIYKTIASDEGFYEGLRLSLSIATISTILSILIGTILIYILYYAMSSYGLEKSMVYKRVIEIPMLFPYIVAGLMMMILFQKSGPISSLFYKIGVTSSQEQFPTIINDADGIGIIITYIWKLAPFVVLMVYPKLMKIEKDWNDLKKVMVADNVIFFKLIILPMIRRELLLSAFIIFAFTFSEFEVPYILGVTYPKTLSVYSYSMFINGDFSQKPIALGLNLIVAMITLLIGGLGYMFLNRRKSYE